MNLFWIIFLCVFAAIGMLVVGIALVCLLFGDDPWGQIH